jgi:PD-(D/E)XK nuclease superfamily
MTDPTPGAGGAGAGAPDAGRELTPVQQRTLQALRRNDPPLVFDPEIIADLRHDADAALADLGARLGDTELFVTKHAIAGVLDCEAHHLAPDPFTWTPARARGQVSHKAIQLLLNWRGEPTPADLVDEALARLADEPHKLGDYVAGLGPGGEADLRGQAVERVTKFLECFPPLDRRWHPMTEASAQFPLEGPIVLRARVDLIIGRPVGRESRKVIIDLKSGRIMPRHREDLRFYALVETLCRDVPPRKLATFSLDSGGAVVEEVTMGHLRSALRRTLDAIERMVELRVEGREPRRTPGVSCRWCPLLDDCEPGQISLSGSADGDADLEP